MSRFPNPLLEDTAPRGRSKERLKSLSRGSILVLAGCALLFVSLFLVWQNLEVDFGQAGTATQRLDGWDFWGLLIAFVVIGLASLVVIVKATDVEISQDVEWDLVILVLAVALLGLTLLKNLTDADSAWASYLGVALAATVVVGAGLDWSRSRDGGRTTLRHRRRRISSAA